MNKNLALFAILLAVSLSWLGCNKSGKLNATSEFKPPTGPVELKLKWPLGERVEQDMDMKMKMETTIPGQPTPVKQDMTMGQTYGLTVLQASPDGTHEIEMDFLTARIGMTMGEKSMVDYDSTKKAEPGKPDPMGDIFGKLVGSKIRYFLDASNGVDRVEGVDDLMNRLSTGAKAEQLAPLKSMFNEGYFKQMMSANRFLPTNAVQPGDTWPVQLEIPLGMLGTMVMNYDFTFERWEMHGKRECARVEFQGTIQSKPGSGANPGGMVMSVQDGATSGIFWFDPELGITIDTTMNQNLTMDMQLHRIRRQKTAAMPKCKASRSR